MARSAEPEPITVTREVTVGYMIVCAVCGHTVVGRRHRRYCSDACRLRAWRARHRAQATSPREGQNRGKAAPSLDSL